MYNISNPIVNVTACILVFTVAYMFAGKILVLKKFLDEKMSARKREIVRRAWLADVDSRKLARFPFVLLWPITLFALKIIYSRKMNHIEAGILFSVRTFSNSLSAGISAQEAIYILAEEVEGPLGKEFALAKDEMLRGVSFDEAIEKMKERISVESFHLFANSVVTLRKLGGNLVETLSLLTNTIEQGVKIREKMKAATAESRSQALLLSIIPWALLVLLYIVDPDFIMPLIKTRLGLLILAAIVVFELAGALWLRKIAEVE